MANEGNVTGEQRFGKRPTKFKSENNLLKNYIHLGRAINVRNQMHGREHRDVHVCIESVSDTVKEKKKERLAQNEKENLKLENIFVM